MTVPFRSVATFNTGESKHSAISYGVLTFPNDYRSCWIIDGQHRLYAFANLTKDFYFNMPVTAFENLSIEHQRKFFLDINKNQKPVNSDLLWDLSGDIPHENDGIISNAVKQLNVDSTSPLHNRIYYPSTGIRGKRGKIKISAMCIAIKRQKIVNDVTAASIKNPLYTSDYKKTTRKTAASLAEFFDCTRELFSPNWNLGSVGFILTNGGIAVMIGLYEKILSRVMQKNRRTASREHFHFYLKPLASFFSVTDANELKKLRLRSTSEGGRAELLSELVDIIRAATKEPTFGGEPKLPIGEEFTELERKLKEIIFEKLNAGNPDWFRGVVDEATYKRALKTMEQNGIKDIKKLHLQISLGQCFNIIRQHKDLFYPLFTDDSNEFAFSSSVVFESAIAIVTSARNRFEAHYTGANAKVDEERPVRDYLAKMNKCLDWALSDSVTTQRNLIEVRF